MKPIDSTPGATALPSPASPSIPTQRTFVPGRAAREEILHRAYEIWEREGHPTDRKLANWLQAEEEILPKDRHPNELTSPETEA